jgi:hypothetical protein
MQHIVSLLGSGHWQAALDASIRVTVQMSPNFIGRYISVFNTFNLNEVHLLLFLSNTFLARVLNP